MRWVLNYNAREQELTNADIARILKVSHGTISNYRTMKTSPKVKFIKDFCGSFGVDEEWLLKGKGEPFMGACALCPELCGPEMREDPFVTAVKSAPWSELISLFHPELPPFSEHEPAFSATGALEFSIAEDLTLAAKVLESRTHYATALHLNIRSFAGAVNDSSTLNSVLARLEDLEGKFENLHSDNKRLILDNNVLKEEIKKLKRHSGGCPPIALGVDHAAPTGTDAPET